MPPKMRPNSTSTARSSSEPGHGTRQAAIADQLATLSDNVQLLLTHQVEVGGPGPGVPFIRKSCVARRFSLTLWLNCENRLMSDAKAM